jgi:hypothetical protein
MTTDFRALCTRMANELDQYRQLLLDDRSVTHRLADEARAELAKPGPEGPTDAELLELTDDWPATTGPRNDLSGCPEVPLYSVFADEVIEFARAVLARWGRPTPQPVPVSERLPEPEDCDAEGRCWYGAPDRPGAVACWDLEYEPATDDTHWLPAHALPSPISQHHL